MLIVYKEGKVCFGLKVLGSFVVDRLEVGWKIVK